MKEFKIAVFKCVHMGKAFRLYLYLVRDARVGKYYKIVPDVLLDGKACEVYRVRLLKDALGIINQFDFCEEVIE